MKPEHLLIGPERLSVKCATCRQFIDGSAHCIGLDCYDEGHCPVCIPEATA